MRDFADSAAPRMVERQLRRRGIDDERVLAAMGAVPREAFVPTAPAPPRLRRLGAADRRRADDLPALDRRRDLPGAGAERLRAGAGGRHRVRLLGRRALACWPREVVSVERHEALAPRRRRALASLGVEQRRAGRRRRQPRRARAGAVRGDRRPRHRPGAAAGAARPARRGRPPGRPDRRRRGRPTC